ncbi:MAG: DUF2167 domain-containing protein [Woeseiaceae bacterium]|nr:DUF2167 domain-containing protein [Woeseiaceae bacterium]
MPASFAPLCRALVAAIALAPLAAIAQDDADYELTPEEIQEIEYYQSVVDSLEPQTGEIVLGSDLATLIVPDGFYFLDADDAETVLVDLWGNLPGQDVLGMLMPAGYSPLDLDSWAVTIDYTEDGYVSDEDAAEIDYDELLRDMQKDTRDWNEERVDAGYEAVELLGWAEPPHYDSTEKKLYWAKELRFGDMQDTTLNYEIRALGRRGILSMTFIAATNQLDEINAHRDEVLAMVAFNEGNRYSDFDPSIDKVAAYGLGALVAGKVAAKTGLLAGLILFLKKFGIFIVIGIAAFFRKILGAFRSEKLEMK